MLKKILGSPHAREVKKLDPIVAQINQICEGLSSLSDDELRAKTEEFRARIKEETKDLEGKIESLKEEKRNSEDGGVREALNQQIGNLDAELLETIEDTLNDLLPEAFAVVKEACRRNLGKEIVVTGQKMAWNMVPYDVQLVGGIALHQGKATEMATGEGKTLVATMPLYLNALAGRGAHLVTVNSYLAQRDAEWMGVIYSFLGLTYDVIDLHDPGTAERREAYNADITYGTNNEFGFDYLRDNMVHTLEQRVQRRHHYVIIDEVDSILIDEARTPLIISGPVGKDSSTPFKQFSAMVSGLYKKQTRLANQLVAEAEKLLEGEDDSEEYQAGEKLLAVKRGTPKHRKLLKMFADEPRLQKLTQRVEGDYMREKILHEIDEQLFFAMDEKGHNVHLSDKGIEELSPNDPEAFIIPDLSHAIGAIEEDASKSLEERRTAIQELEAAYAAKSQKMHVIHQLLKAYTLFHKDEQYIIGEDGSVVIVDEFTGRQMAGRRWSDGLHQAVEAKEGVEIRGETQTLATITIQNYFRMYDKLAGMTGTAETEENEFHQIYTLDVLVIPTNRPVIRDDRDDLIFRTKREKFTALMDEVERLNKMELPVLVGTTNVEVSETLSRMLKRRGLKHNVLNAKHHKKESEIVAEAGIPGAVTIATNMAGRGTDIKLGEGVTETRTVAWAKAKGLPLEELLPVDPVRYMEPEKLTDEDLLEEGGLHILGSERHESRRIDRQLRGRSGRQGDPGASQFFLSLEDDLMRLFMNERVAGAMEKWGVQEGEVITHGLVTRSIGQAQKRVEGNNFEARKRLLDYDDVMNQQREVIYDLRLFALEGGEDLKGEIWEMIEESVREMTEEFCDPEVSPEMWDLAGLKRRLLLDFFVLAPGLPEVNPEEPEYDDGEAVAEIVLEAARDHFHRKVTDFGEHGERVMSFVMLQTLDDKWKDHLYDLDHLKASIGFRGWGQKDPLIEYKKDAYEMFVDLMTDIRKTVTSLFFRAQMGAPQQRRMPAAQRLMYSGPTEVPTSRFGAMAGETATGATGKPRGSGTGTFGGGMDDLGVSRTAGAPGPAQGGVAVPSSSGPDPRQLLTNRGEARKQAPVTGTSEPGRNDPCPCGSGKKYKKCCGRNA
ncbi:MAG: preprotein translocase subunit SecA [Gemmatimonadetes bacterium]|nr:preprotein translocase subunit SecA [Gemmatimonadota bacterium]